MNKRMFLLLLIVFFLVLVVVPQKTTVEQSAKRILAACKNADYRPTCYEQEIPKLFGAHSLEEVFAVTRRVQDEDPSYLYCHTLGHKISFIESQRHPDQWKNILSRCPLAMCNYGCLHGSLIQRFRGETLTEAQIAEVTPDLADICEKRPGFSPTGMDQAMCYHAIGHLALYITGGKPEKAIPVCEAVSKKNDERDFTDICVQGAFMTVFQAADPEDLSLVRDIKPEPKDVPSFCRQYGGHWQSCRREAFPLFSQEILTPDGLLKFCSYATDGPHWENCALGVLNIIADTYFREPDGLAKTHTYCSGIPRDKRATCYAGIAMRLVQIEPRRHIETAAAICHEAATYGYAQPCWQSLTYYGQVSYQQGDRTQRDYCSHLPMEFQESCGKQ